MEARCVAAGVEKFLGDQIRCGPFSADQIESLEGTDAPSGRRLTL